MGNREGGPTMGWSWTDTLVNVPDDANEDATLPSRPVVYGEPAPIFTRFDYTDLSVVIVEDNDEERYVLTHMLSARGLAVHAASTLEYARKLLDHRDGPKIALIDWMLAEANGMDLVRWVRTQTASDYVYCIMTTSMQEELSMRHAYAAGVDAYLRKPLDANDVESEVHRAIAVMSSPVDLRHCEPGERFA